MKNKRKMEHCERCGWDWFPIVEEPTVCPKCKSPWWDKKKGVQS